MNVLKRRSLLAASLLIAGFFFVDIVMLTVCAQRLYAQNQASQNQPAPSRQDQPAQTPNVTATSAETQADDEELPEAELAPAAVDLDVSHSSPLIQALYHSTRETKKNEILARLDNAKSLIASANVNAVDERGRTALHWTVFGASYSKSSKVMVAYEEIANALIQRGVDINKQDMYQDTALDYLLYSPSFEIQTLLIEHGANSGFLAASYQFLRQQGTNCSGDKPEAEKVPNVPNADLTPGLTLSLRLDTPVYSDRSRTGDPIEATVTYPLCKTGEGIACKQGELLIPPGTKVNGTVLFAQKAPNKYSRPRLVLDFSNIVHTANNSPLYAHVLDIDNARETVRNNEILGIIQPHANKKLSIAMIAVSVSNPFAGYAVKGVQAVYGLSVRREIAYPAGTDMQVQVVRYSTLKQKLAWPGWKKLPVDGHLQTLAVNAPMRTSTPGNQPSDPTNLMFLGSDKEVISAFSEAGWVQANDLNVKSALKTATATLRQTGYNDAPVSTLLLQGRPPELVFQKSLNTFAKRHHLRVWKLTPTYNGRNVWIAAATHDIATQNERGGTKWTHRIDPHVDREREWVQTDLLFIGSAKSYVEIDRPQAPKQLSNATGDTILTDGRLSVVDLARPGGSDEKNAAPTLTNRPSK